MASGNIGPIASTSTENGWTCFNIGTMCIAFYYRQFEGISMTTSWDGAFRSNLLTYVQAPQFLDYSNAIYGCMTAGGSQSGGLFVGRVYLESSDSTLKGYLAAHKSQNSVNIPILIVAIGQRV